MLQIYTFVGEAQSTPSAASEARNKVNHFLAKDQEANLVEVTQVLQSESQCVSVWDGTNDWSYSFSITLVCNIHAGDVEKIYQMYLAS
jgi:hypothetical protein